MKTLHTQLAALSLAGACLALSASPTIKPSSQDAWKWDLTIYGFGASMSGDLAIRGIDIPYDLPASTIMENLEMGAMGKISATKGKWSINGDLIYMGLGASSNGVSADVDQLVIEPSVGYHLTPGFQVLAGVRYNDLSTTISGNLPKLGQQSYSESESWYDPIIGFDFQAPLGSKLGFAMRGDIGGFGVGSDQTWQAFPELTWQTSDTLSIRCGYRWVYTNYETGSGKDRFKYDVLSEGPQLGVRFSF